MTVYDNMNKKARGFVLNLWRNLILSLLGMVLLSACATTRPPAPVYPPVHQNEQQKHETGEPEKPETSDIDEEDVGARNDKGEEIKEIPIVKDEPIDKGVRPAFMGEGKIKRIAIILPLSARSRTLRREAASMLQAAEMSVFDLKDDKVLLIPLDSKGTPTGASNAAKQAIEQGADIILGPITAPSVNAVGKLAKKANIPVIGFSTDTKVAGQGVYLLSFPPEAEVKRISSFAAKAGARRFAFIGPDSVYGRRVLNAYKSEIANLGGQLTGYETYKGKDISVMQEPMQKLASMFPTSEQIKQNPDYEDPYHVILMPESGTALRSLAPLLTFYNENTRHVQLMGTSLWYREEIAKEPALSGGIFAGPDLEAAKSFNARYDAIYGQEPKRLASQAYDGVTIAAFVTDGEDEERISRLTASDGFYGVDGFVRFTPFGTPERGLAIYQIRNGRFVVLEPAPKTADDIS